MTLPCCTAGDEVQDSDCDRRVGAHEQLHDQLFGLHRPGRGHEKKQDRKGKMPQPRSAARKMQRAKRDEYRDERHRPTDEPPIRIRDRNQTDGQQNGRSEQRQTCR
jgi:hypothetical protein